MEELERAHASTEAVETELTKELDNGRLVRYDERLPFCRFIDLAPLLCSFRSSRV